jgi:hypothetical protein
MKRKFKVIFVNSTTVNNMNNRLILNELGRNPCAGLGQVQKWDGVKPVIVMPTLPVDNWISNDNMTIHI